jgi:hypothetical protein
MPVDRSVIDAQLRDIGEGDRWWEQREFRDLPYILHADERIRAVVNGKLLGRRRPRIFPRAQWLVVATDQRLLCLKEERFGRQQVDLPLGQIGGLRHTTGMRGVLVTVDTPGSRFRLRIAKGDAFRFIGALSPLLPQLAAAVDAALGLPASQRPGLLARVGVGGSPSGDFVSRAELARVEETVHRLEGEIDRLQQHVEFLENLLEARAGGAYSRAVSSGDV